MTLTCSKPIKRQGITVANLFETIYTLWLREILRFIKSKSRVIGSGGQPLIWLAIIGVGFGSAFTFASGQHISYITFMAPGILGMTLLFSSIFAGVNILWDKQFGFLKEILVSPVPRLGIVLGKIAGSATVSLLAGLVVLTIVVIAGVIPLSMLSVTGIASSYSVHDIDLFDIRCYRSYNRINNKQH